MFAKRERRQLPPFPFLWPKRFIVGFSVRGTICRFDRRAAGSAGQFGAEIERLEPDLAIHRHRSAERHPPRAASAPLVTVTTSLCPLCPSKAFGQEVGPGPPWLAASAIVIEPEGDRGLRDPLLVVLLASEAAVGTARLRPAC